MLDPTTTSHLLCALERATRAHPETAKLLVAPVQRTAADLLEGLSRGGGDTRHWSVITPRALATSLVHRELEAEGVRAADDLDEAALVEAALDRLLEERPGASAVALDGAGFRGALARSIRALRIAGVDGPSLAGAAIPDPEKRDLLSGVLARYEQGLRDARLADPAELFRRATGALHAGRRPFGRVYLVPGLYRGLTGTFLRALLQDGAQVLPTDPAEGLPVPAEALWSAGAPAGARSFLHAPDRCALPEPSLGLFAGASRMDEVREVLRRAIATGRRWEDVEVVAADPAYAALLDGLARRLEIPVEHGMGLPVGRTRLGRALGLYLDWIETGFRVEHLRPLLEAGDLPGSGEGVPGPALARRLAGLGIVRGRGRYLPRIDAAMVRAPDEGARAELASLRALICALLDPIPEAERVSPATLAAAAERFLGLVRLPPSDPVRDALERRLARIAATLHRAVSLQAAVASLRARLALHVPPDAEEDEDMPGVAAEPGAPGLLLTSLRHGGRSGRRHTFIVGLSAEAFPGAGIQDPLLTDEDRRALADLHPAAASGLPTVAELLAEKKHALAATLAGIRGGLTLSFPGWSPTEARQVAPAAILLQALRVRVGDPAADYERLRGELAGLHGAVPRAETHLDAQDAWMGALHQDGVLLDGVAQVRCAHAGLDGGLRAQEARFGAELSPHHGVIVPRPAQLDPRENSGLVVSASRMETLGRCPHLYLLKYVLRAEVPERPATDPEAWLDPRARGTLLHHVFEHALRAARERGIGAEDDQVLEIALALLDDAVRELRDELLPPSELVFRREHQDLRHDIRAWAASLRDDPAEWVEFELAFGGPEAAHPPVPIALPGGTILTQGAIDRVDRLADGQLRIVDYKTGSPSKYSRKSGVFHGGRRIQHFLYTAVAESVRGEPVGRMEYVFPTQRGQNGRATFERDEVAGGPALLDALLSLVEAGHFLPTEEPSDCGYCDYRCVCRVEGEGSQAYAPLAEWAKARSPEIPAYGPLVQVRTQFA